MNSKERRECRYQRRQLKRQTRKLELNKFYGNYDEIFTFENLYKAYKLCCKGVGWKASTQRYKTNSLLNTHKTFTNLKNRTYRSNGFQEFMLYDAGKLRQIRSVHISERIVQRCLCDNALVPMFQNSFIYDNGACMKGKGTTFALKRLKENMTHFYKKNETNGYILVFDFSKYFARIQHQPLFHELERRFIDRDLIALTKHFITNFGKEGLGLGSQVSQICALMYPNKLDHFIKEVLRIKYYARYMDDGYLIHESKEYLQYCLKEIKRVCDNLGIVLNPHKTQIIKLTRGVSFLKRKFTYTSTGKIIIRPNKKNTTRQRRKLKIFKTWYEQGKFPIEDIKVSFTSWKGGLKRTSSYRIIRRMTLLFNKLFYGG